MPERQRVDARNAYCPGPLLELIAALKLVGIGDEVEVLSTDQGSARDIPEWVAKVRHELVSIDRHETEWSIVVRKAK